MSTLIWGTVGWSLNEIAWDENGFRKPHLSTSLILKLYPSNIQYMLVFVFCWFCQCVNFWIGVDFVCFTVVYHYDRHSTGRFFRAKLRDGKNTWWTYQSEMSKHTWNQNWYEGASEIKDVCFGVGSSVSFLFQKKTHGGETSDRKGEAYGHADF